MKKRIERIDINTEWCKGCGICVAFCPKQVLVLNGRGKSEVARLDDCIACMMCALRCPDLAIDVFTTQKEADRKDDHTAR